MIKKILSTALLAGILLTATVTAAQPVSAADYTTNTTVYRNVWQIIFGGYTTPTKPTPKPIPTPPASKPPANSTNPTKPTNPADQTSQFEKKVLELVNAERANYGLKPLQWDDKVASVARLKSQDMRDKNYFSHTSPTYGSPFEMMKKYGVTFRSAGENIAAGQTTPEAVVKGWMNSEGHRKNILSASFTHLGVGYAAGGSYKHYWTQMFIGK
jgi:uncharacterized YkwD family protein